MTNSWLESWADIDGEYRYTLGRAWGGLFIGRAVFIMLNPSTADADIDDPTIRRCIGFAKRERWSSIEVINLFALRATDPRELAKHPDPVGTRNDVALIDAVGGAEAVICAWGAHPMAQDRGAKVLRWLHGVNGLSVVRLGKPTKNGSPRHPLYLARDTPLQAM